MHDKVRPVRKWNAELHKVFSAYFIAAVGPIGSAVAQFGLSLVLLRWLEPGDFGRFTFLLIASQLALGVWSALFCAPLPTLLSSQESARRDQYLSCLLSSNLRGSIAALFFMFVLGLLVSKTLTSSALFAIYSAFSLLRWFARAQAYALGQTKRTVYSDVVFFVSLLAAVFIIIFAKQVSLESAFLGLAISAGVGLIPFGRRWARQQFRWSRSGKGEVTYRQIWQQHSKWALVGVITTEITANAHVYIVTFIYGTAAFASLAASALLVRPITVTANALTEFERARIARHLSDNDAAAVTATLWWFRCALIGICGATAVASAVLLATAPQLVFPQKYALDVLSLGVALWMIVALVRSLRTPESVMLQAAGEFKTLAFASVFAAIGSAVAVLALAVWAGSLWSILGILLGELILAIWIWRQASSLVRF